MSTVDLALCCPACGSSALADDDYCEACGAAVGRQRDARWEHVEVEAGSVAGISDRGLRHERNEDAVFVAAAGRGAVAVVCDGVSASVAPQMASQVAAQTTGAWLLDRLRARPPKPDVATVVEGLGRGSRAVADLPWLAAPDRTGPSCAAVAAVWDGTVLALGWAGDSRAYWVDRDGASLLTVDHSWAQERIASGEMTPAAAELDPRAHAITRWLGEDAPAPAESTEWLPRREGSVVLCTDGLWNVLDGVDELARVCAPALGDGPLALARRLVSLALGRGGPDNVTVAVIDVEPGGD